MISPPAQAPFDQIAELIRQTHNRDSAKKRCQPGSLFECLYNAYCRFSNFPGDFRRLREADGFYRYRDARKTLFQWYTEHYSGEFSEFRLETGGKGTSRTVSHEAALRALQNGEDWRGEYHFDQLYDIRAFDRYLLPEGEDLTLDTSQDFFSFILHTAVAFFLTPGELNSVLKRYGFQSLHVRNLHHLAIYAALQEANSYSGADLRFCNPFEMVKDRYADACLILSEPEPGESRDGAFPDSDLTVHVKNALNAQTDLYVNFGQFVRNNRSSFSTRHQKILRDFHCLYAVYSNLNRGDGEPAEYALRSFLERFCLSKPESKLSQLTRGKKQPTRELMILCWMYAYCFAFVQYTSVTSKTMDSITELLENVEPGWAEKIQAHGLIREFTPGYVEFDTLNFLRVFLNESGGGTVERRFHGSNLVEFLNRILGRRYEWGSLNGSRKFDQYLVALNGLTIDGYACGESGFRITGITYQGRCLDGMDLPVPSNVPYPLYAITELLRRAQAHPPKTRAGEEDTPWFPLGCRLYDFS